MLFEQDELDVYMANLENKQPVLPNLPNTPIPSTYTKKI